MRDERTHGMFIGTNHKVIVRCLRKIRRGKGRFWMVFRNISRKEASHSRFPESFPISQLLRVPPRPSPCGAIFSRANFFHSPKAAFWAFRVKLIILLLFLWLLVLLRSSLPLKFLYFLHLLFIYTHSRLGATRSLPAFLLSSFFFGEGVRFSATWNLCRSIVRLPGMFFVDGTFGWEKPTNGDENVDPSSELC